MGETAPTLIVRQHTVHALALGVIGRPKTVDASSSTDGRVFRLGIFCVPTRPFWAMLAICGEKPTRDQLVGFSQIETCWLLSLVKGSRLRHQPLAVDVLEAPAAPPQRPELKHCSWVAERRGVVQGSGVKVAGLRLRGCQRSGFQARGSEIERWRRAFLTVATWSATLANAQTTSWV